MLSLFDVFNEYFSYFTIFLLHTMFKEVNLY